MVKFNDTSVLVVVAACLAAGYFTLKELKQTPLPVVAENQQPSSPGPTGLDYTMVSPWLTGDYSHPRDLNRIMAPAIFKGQDSLVGGLNCYRELKARRLPDEDIMLRVYQNYMEKFPLVNTADGSPLAYTTATYTPLPKCPA